MESVKKQWNHSSRADYEKIRSMFDEWGLHPLAADILLSRGFKTQKEIQSFLDRNIVNENIE